MFKDTNNQNRTTSTKQANICCDTARKIRLSHTKKIIQILEQIYTLFYNYNKYIIQTTQPKQSCNSGTIKMKN